MSVIQDRIHLVQTKARGAKVRAIVPAIQAAAQVALGLVGTMLGACDRNMEEWARIERVKWYEGAGH